MHAPHLLRCEVRDLSHMIRVCVCEHERKKTSLKYIPNVERGLKAWVECQDWELERMIFWRIMWLKSRLEEPGAALLIWWDEMRWFRWLVFCWKREEEEGWFESIGVKELIWNEAKSWLEREYFTVDSNKNHKANAHDQFRILKHMYKFL